MTTFLALQNCFDNNAANYRTKNARPSNVTSVWWKYTGSLMYWFPKVRVSLNIACLQLPPVYIFPKRTNLLSSEESHILTNWEIQHKKNLDKFRILIRKTIIHSVLSSKIRRFYFPLYDNFMQKLQLIYNNKYYIFLQLFYAIMFIISFDFFLQLY